MFNIIFKNTMPHDISALCKVSIQLGPILRILTLITFLNLPKQIVTSQFM